MTTSLERDPLPPMISYEHRWVNITPEQAATAAKVLRSLGVSTHCSRQGTLKALIRLGKAGARDRASIHHVELRFAALRIQRVWLEICWQLPNNHLNGVHD